MLELGDAPYVGVPCWSGRAERWAAVLAGPAAHGWTARDVNALIGDWVGVGHWLPDAPHKPIGLLGAIVGWHCRHNDLDVRPAALKEARDTAQRAAHRARLAAQLAGRAEHARARAAGRAALNSPGHAAAHAVAAQAARRAAHNRAFTEATDTLARDAALRRACGLPAAGR